MLRIAIIVFFLATVSVLANDNLNLITCTTGSGPRLVDAFNEYWWSRSDLITYRSVFSQKTVFVNMTGCTIVQGVTKADLDAHLGRSLERGYLSGYGYLDNK